MRDALARRNAPDEAAIRMALLDEQFPLFELSLIRGHEQIQLAGESARVRAQAGDSIVDFDGRSGDLFYLPRSDIELVHLHRAQSLIARNHQIDRALIARDVLADIDEAGLERLDAREASAGQIVHLQSAFAAGEQQHAAARVGGMDPDSGIASSLAKRRHRRAARCDDFGRIGGGHRGLRRGSARCRRGETCHRCHKKNV